MDIYSLLDLAKSLIPESEFEFLDKLKKEIEKRKSKINSRKISKKLKILEKLLDRQDFLKRFHGNILPRLYPPVLYLVQFILIS